MPVRRARKKGELWLLQRKRSEKKGTSHGTCTPRHARYRRAEENGAHRETTARMSERKAGGNRIQAHAKKEIWVTGLTSKEQVNSAWSLRKGNWGFQEKKVKRRKVKRHNEDALASRDKKKKTIPSPAATPKGTQERH